MTNVTEVGFLGFGTGFSDDAISVLMGELQTVHRTAQALLDKNALSFSVEVDGFDQVKRGVDETEKELTSAQKAIKLYTAEVREAIALEKTGNSTREDTAKKIRALTTEVKSQLGQVDKLSADHRELTKAMEGAGTAALKLERDQTRALKALQDDQVRQYRDAVVNLRTELERGATSREDFISDTMRLQTEMVELRDTLSTTSPAFGALDRVIGTSARGLQTAEGQVSKLGLSQQVALGSTKNLAGGLGTLNTSVSNLGAALPGLIGVAGFGGLLSISGDLATKANAVNVSYDILQLTLERTGQSGEAAQSAIAEVSTTLGVAEGQVVDYITQLSRVGFSTDEAADALIAGGASALAFGKTAAQGMDSVTSALVTQNSQALNTIGIAENIGAAMGEAADGAVQYGEAASQQAAAQAGLEVILKATGAEVASLDKLTGGLAGSQNDAATAAFNAKQRFGELLIPIQTLRNEALAGLLNSFDAMPDTAQASIVSIGGITGAVAALATGASALRLALVPLFAPPAGLIIGAIALAAGLGVAIFNAAKNFEPAADKVKRLADAALEVPPGLDAIKNATSKEELLGSVQTLAETMDGDARFAFQNYATDAVTSAETVGDAVIGVLQGVAVARKTMLEDAIDAQEELLATLEENVARSQTAFNIASSTGQNPNENQAIIRLREEMAEVEEAIEEGERDLTEAVARGQTARSESIRATLEADRKYLNTLIGEIGQELANTPTGRLNIDTSQAQEAQRDLEALQTRYDDLVNLIENGDASEIEEYFAAGAPGAQKLATGIGAPGDSPSAPGVAGKLTAFQENLQETGRLVMSLSGSMAAQELKLRFDGDPQEAITALRGIATTAAAAAQQALEEGKPQRAAALLDIGEQAETQIAGLQATIRDGLEPVDVAFAKTTGEAENFSDSLSGLGNQGAFQGFLNSVADGSYAATTSVQSLTGATREQQFALRQSQIDWRDTQVAVANASSTTDEYLASMMREQQAWADRARAQKEATKNWRALRDEGESAADVAGKTAEQYGLQASTLQDVTARLKTAENRFRVTGDAQAYTAEKAAIYGDALNTLIDAGFDPLDPAVRNYARRLAEASKAEGIAADTAQAAQEAEEARAEGLEALGDAQKDHAKLSRLDSDATLEHLDGLRELADAYPELADDIAPLIKETEDHAKAQLAAEKASKSLADAQESLADAASLSYDDIVELRMSLTELAAGEGAAAEQAEVLLARLAALEEGRQVGLMFQELGKLAGIALETIPDLSDEATVALGALQGAGEATFSALQDGSISTGDALSIIAGAVAGVAAAFGDELTPEANIALSAIEGAASGAATGFAVGGPIGAAIGGIIGLIGGIGQAAAENAKRAKEEFERATKAAERLLQIAVDGQRAAQEMSLDALETANDTAFAEGIITEAEYVVRKTQLELAQERLRFQQDYNRIEAERKAALEGVTDQAEIDRINANFDAQLDALTTGYQANTDAIISGNMDAAEAAGLGQEEFLDELAQVPQDIVAVYAEAEGVVLGAVNNFSLVYGNGVTYGAGGVVDAQNKAGLDLQTSGRSMGVQGAQGLNEGATMLSTTATSSFGSLSGTIEGLVATLTGRQGGLGSSLSGGFLSMFGSSRDAVITGGQNLNTTVGTTLGKVTGTVDDEAALLRLRLHDEERILVERQRALFDEQQKMAHARGPLAAAELKAQILRQREALQVSLYGSGGFSPFLTTATGSVSGLLGTFFQTQRNTVTREAGTTARAIGDSTRTVASAMRSLVSAASGYTGVSKSLRGGGGSGKSFTFNAFQSLSDTVDPRALGGFGDDFSLNSHLYGTPPEEEFGQGFHRETFGYGTALAREEPVSQPVSRKGLDNSLFGSILKRLTADATTLKRGSVAQINSAIKTLQKGKDALQKEVERRNPVKKKPTPKKSANPVSQLSDEVKQTIEETNEAIRVFQTDSFDFISGASLFNLKKSGKSYLVGGLLKSLLGSRVDFQKGLTDSQKEVLQFATQVGQGLEKAVSGGLSSGIKAAMLSGEMVDFKNIMGSVFDSTFDGLFQQISSGVIQKAFGPLLTDLTGDIARGDTKGAAANIAAINAKLPGVAAQIQQLLAPLQAVANIGQTPASAQASTGGITLQQRELGGASVYPTWIDPLGATLQSAADTMWRSAQYNRQTVEMMRALILSPSGRSRLEGGSSSVF